MKKVAASVVLLSAVAAAQVDQPAAYFPPVLFDKPSHAAAPKARVFTVAANGALNLNAVAVDGNRNIFVAGSGRATDVPGLAGGFQPKPNGYDAFIAKLDPRGGVTWSTYLGGTDFYDFEASLNSDIATSIAIDASGNAYVAGSTATRNFPTVNAFRATNTTGGSEAFVAKFNSNGTLLFSTLLGTFGSATQIAVGPAGESWTLSYAPSRMPATTDLSRGRSGFSQLYITKLNPVGSPVWTTRLWPASTLGFGVDGAGRAYIATAESGVFPSRLCRISVAQLDTSGSAVLYEATFDEQLQQNASCTGNRAFAVTADGRAIVSGLGCALTLPTRRAPSARTPNCAEESRNRWLAALSSSGEVDTVTHTDVGTHDFVSSDPEGRIVLMSGRPPAGLPAIRALVDHHVDGPIYVSDDRGESWQAGRGFRIAPSVRIYDFDFDAGRRSVYAAVDGRPAVYESADDGRTWQQDDRARDLPYAFSLAVDRRDTSIRYTSSGGHIQRQDARSDWQIVVRYVDVSWYPVEANPHDGWVWAGARGAWAFSFDSGRSWFRKHFLAPSGVHLSPSWLVFHPTRPGTMYAGTNAATSDAYVSRDNGDSWQRFTPSASGLVISSVAIDPMRNVIYAGAGGFYTPARLGVLRSDDDGRSWVSKLPGHRITAVAVDPARPNIVYAGGVEPNDRGVLYRSTDAGETWQRAMTGLHLRGAVSRLFIDPRDSTRVYLGAVLGNVPYLRRLIPGRSTLMTRTDFATYLGHGTPRAVTVAPTGEILVGLDIPASSFSVTSAQVAVVVIDDVEREITPAPRRPR